jgi:hypothetical protein
MKVPRPFLHSFAAAGLLCATLSVSAQAHQSRMQCSPITPETKVPFIEVEQLPNVAHDPLYFHWCTDLDSAWTPQSYPDAKYVPKRTPEHEARVNLLLLGLKELVTAEPDDWVSYVNAWLGSNLPPPNVYRRSFPDGEATSSISNAESNSLTKFKTTSKAISANSWQQVSSQGAVIYSERKLSIRGLDTTTLCITSVDLQKAFENQPGYLFRPLTVRASQTRPNPEDLAKLGGQWFGYEVYAFSDLTTKQEPGLMDFGFGFKPCAARININININIIKKNLQGDKK